MDGLAAVYAVIDTQWAPVGWAPNPLTDQESTTYLDLMKALLENGADPNARLVRKLWFRPTHHDESWINAAGATAFWRAAQATDLKAMRLLVAHGADLKSATGEGVNPLMVAAGLGWNGNFSTQGPDTALATVKYCLELGIDPTPQSTQGYTALSGAAYRGDNGLVTLLVSKGVKLDTRTARGWTLTDMANGPSLRSSVPVKHPATVALLLKLGAPPLTSVADEEILGVIRRRPVAAAADTATEKATEATGSFTPNAPKQTPKTFAQKETPRVKNWKYILGASALTLTAFAPVTIAHAQTARGRNPEQSTQSGPIPYDALLKKPTAGSYPIEFELMTWPEIYRATHEDGKTTALVFNGGTEQRGPQGVAGAHTFVARSLGKEIAEKLGNAVVAPVLPFSVNGEASEQIPGTIGVSGPLFAAINEEVAEQLIHNGFKNVVLLGDHGGGQRELGEVAKKLDEKYAPQGIHVVYAADGYAKAGAEFNKWLVEKNLPVGSHASIKDTSELLYLEGDRPWVRKDQIATAVGGRAQPGSVPNPDVTLARNGISGDARKSSPEIGKKISDLKVEFAVAQIRTLLHEDVAAK